MKGTSLSPPALSHLPATAPHAGPSRSPQEGPGDPAAGGGGRCRDPASPSPVLVLRRCQRQSQAGVSQQVRRLPAVPAGFFFPSGLNRPWQDPKSGGYSSVTHERWGRAGRSAWGHAGLEVVALRPCGPQVLVCSGQGGFEAPRVSPAPTAALGQSSTAEGHHSRKRQSCSFTKVECPRA